MPQAKTREGDTNLGKCDDWQQDSSPGHRSTQRQRQLPRPTSVLQWRSWGTDLGNARSGKQCGLGEGCRDGKCEGTNKWTEINARVDADHVTRRGNLLSN